MNTYDVIVIGTGGVGSAAVFHLASRGVRVLGLERFTAGHDRGSSHGQTRIIRKAYFEHPDYVPLLHRSYVLWHELQELLGEKLYHDVGLLEVGAPDGAVVPGILASAQQHNLPLERLSPVEVDERFPGYVVPEGDTALFEREAGYLLVERCVLAHLSAASQRGAEVKYEEAVQGWEATGSGVKVQTESGVYHAEKLVIAAGPWSGEVVGQLGVPLRVIRKHLHWYECDNHRYRADHGYPAFFYEAQGGYFYGFPCIDERGVKVAEHSGGATVSDPLTDDHSLEQEDRRRVEAFLQAYLPNVSSRASGHAVCYYTSSPDEHFIVDQHPQHPQVAFAAGLSGHGFKMTCALGEALADLSLTGRTTLPIGFLGLARFS